MNKKNVFLHIVRAMLTANLSTLTPHASLMFDEDNSTDSENGTSDDIDGEKKESLEKNINTENTQVKHSAAASQEPGMYLFYHII